MPTDNHESRFTPVPDVCRRIFSGKNPARPDLPVHRQDQPLVHQNIGNLKCFTKWQQTGFLIANWRSVASKSVGKITKINFRSFALVFVLLIFATGCATNSGVQSTDKSQEIQENINITENYNVDDEIRDEFDKAVALMKEGKYDEAIMLLRAVTGKVGKLSGPFINLAIAYSRTDQLDKAEENLLKALKLNKSHPVANNELALIYRRTGRFKEARKIYENILQQYPNFLPARKNFGILCDLYLRDLDCALQQYEAYLEILPDDKNVKIWVADLKNRM